MTEGKRDLDEFGRKALEPLRPAPPLDPDIYPREKEKFLLHGERLRKHMISNLAPSQPQKAGRKRSFHAFVSLPLFKALAVILLVVALLAGSSISVYAAQNSLPGEALYNLKTISEDIRLSLTFSPQAKLDLTLEYTNRRLNEIQSLVVDGKPLPDQAANRYQQELDEALQLATQLNDQQIMRALNAIKTQAEEQGTNIN